MVRGRQANPRYANGHQRRKVRARVLAAYDVCAWPWCEWPGQPVDKNLPTPHPLSAEVDEIVPVSLGGDPLAFDNLQLLHRICNQRKGNGSRAPRSVESVPGPIETSREW